MNEKKVIRLYKESRKAKETGNPYDVFVLEYRGYKKIIFLNGAEKFVFEDVPLDLELYEEF